VSDISRIYDDRAVPHPGIAELKVGDDGLDGRVDEYFSLVPFLL